MLQAHRNRVLRFISEGLYKSVSLKSGIQKITFSSVTLKSERNYVSRCGRQGRKQINSLIYSYLIRVNVFNSLAFFVSCNINHFAQRRWAPFHI